MSELTDTLALAETNFANRRMNHAIGALIQAVGMIAAKMEAEAQPVMPRPPEVTKMITETFPEKVTETIAETVTEKVTETIPETTTPEALAATMKPKAPKAKTTK